jgi:hypothetical protein
MNSLNYSHFHSFNNLLKCIPLENKKYLSIENKIFYRTVPIIDGS